MNKNGLIVGAVTAAVVIILLGTLLIPVIDDTQTVTYSNAVGAIETLDKIEGDDEYVIEYMTDHYTLDGSNIFTDMTLYTDHGWVYLTGSSISGVYTETVRTSPITAITTTTTKITLTDGHMVIETEGDEVDVAVGWAFITSTHGEYGVITSDSIYTSADLEVYWIQAFGNYLAVMDGPEGYFQNQTFSGYLSVTEINDEVSEVELPIPVSGQWSVSKCIAPLRLVSAEPTSYGAILYAIPVLVIVALMITVLRGSKLD